MPRSEGRHGELVHYQARDGAVRLDVRLEEETVWLSLNQMAKLFDRDKSVISRHLRNIFQSKELEGDSVVARNATTAADGKTRRRVLQPRRDHFRGLPRQLAA